MSAVSQPRNVTLAARGVFQENTHSGIARLKRLIRFGPRGCIVWSEVAGE